ncbi:tRNA (adenosine(37)-N6)-threonylcarbamoyltransferase complex transferase subunit TsaD [Planctomicrobium sp. SH664]|uniref:tRNA (adenosine(37)-N6)-threonylcarbamoyltransferase complex transferase subunit TsaD n=1 Tax=Planctomicrobium sp. SH664 TaxID=3448125 RepID=UPI003F5B2A81
MTELQSSPLPPPVAAADSASVGPLLAIESSCDETAAAVVDEQLRVLSSVVASQDELHQRFGGVVPEIASRAHLSRILPVIQAALERAKISLSQLSAVAVMTEPGLVGSLLVGVTAAKTLALVLNKPLIAVNHIHAHLYACRMIAERDVFPAIGLVVSGGHTNLYDCKSAIEYELIGSTIDDAAGEAFDKAAALLGLPYPGGPWIQKIAQGGNRKAFDFPRSFLHDDRLAFSFSGLKTALRYTAIGQPGSKQVIPPLTPERTADLAASFQEAVVDVLIGKCRQALKRYRRRTLCIGGGVAANARFRERLEELRKKNGIDVVIAPLSLCTDNAAMGAIAWELLRAGKTAPLDVDVTPGLVRQA